jgi:hypothetical protein
MTYRNRMSALGRIGLQRPVVFTPGFIDALQHLLECAHDLYPEGLPRWLQEDVDLVEVVMLKAGGNT